MGSCARSRRHVEYIGVVSEGKRKDKTLDFVIDWVVCLLRMKALGKHCRLGRIEGNE